MKNTYRITDPITGATVLVTIEAVEDPSPTMKESRETGAHFDTIAYDVVEAIEAGTGIVPEQE